MAVITLGFLGSISVYHGRTFLGFQSPKYGLSGSLCRIGSLCEEFLWELLLILNRLVCIVLSYHTHPGVFGVLWVVCIDFLVGHLRPYIYHFPHCALDFLTTVSATCSHSYYLAFSTLCIGLSYRPHTTSGQRALDFLTGHIRPSHSHILVVPALCIGLSYWRRSTEPCQYSQTAC